MSSGGGYSQDDKILFEMDLALGKYPGILSINVVGQNEDTGSEHEDIWPAGGIKSYLTSAETLDVVSDNANDNVSGTGAQSILIKGLDSNYDFIEEVVILNGITPVTTTSAFLRVYSSLVVTAGSSENNEGIITISATTSGHTESLIEAAYGLSLGAFYTIPRGYVALLTSYAVGVAKGQSAEVELVFRPAGGAKLVAGHVDLYQATSTYLPGGPEVIPEKTDISLRAKVDMGSTHSSGGYHLWLIKQEED